MSRASPPCGAGGTAQPNLRRVHLNHAELHEGLAAVGSELAPGEMGENVTTRGLDLLEPWLTLGRV